MRTRIAKKQNLPPAMYGFGDMGNNTYSVPTDREIHALENPHRERITYRIRYI